MKNFINIKDVPASDLRKIISDAKKRKKKRKNLNTLDLDKDKPLKGKLLIQMFEKASLRTRLSFYLAIKQLGGDTLTLRTNELHLGKGGESLADVAQRSLPFLANLPSVDGSTLVVAHGGLLRVGKGPSAYRKGPEREAPALRRRGLRVGAVTSSCSRALRRPAASSR